MKVTAYLVLLAVAGALFLLAGLRIALIPALDFAALGLFFLTAAWVVEHMRAR